MRDIAHYNQDMQEKEEKIIHINGNYENQQDYQSMKQQQKTKLQLL